MSDSWRAGSGSGGVDRADEESSGTPLPEDTNGPSDRGPTGPGRRLSRVVVVVTVLAVLAGGVVWLFRDELFHPFGDVRACEGSDVRLPGVIRAGGAPIPEGASDVHYFTHDGDAEVTFVSGRMADYLHRAGILREGEPLFDEQHGTKGVADDRIDLPAGLCGPSLRGPVWHYHSTTATGSSVDVVVERSPTANDAFRLPARAVVTYHLY